MTTEPLAVPLTGIRNAMVLGNTSPGATARMLDDLLAKHRDQVLTEAHGLVQDVLPCPVGCDCAGQRAAAALLAARTSQEGSPATDEQQAVGR